MLKEILMRFRNADDEMDYYGTAFFGGFPAALEELTEAERRRERQGSSYYGSDDDDDDEDDDW